MAIQPIDLQNMYSQLSNVAKNVVGVEHSAQVSQNIQQQSQIQKSMENNKKVQQTNDDKARMNNVNENGHHGGAATYQNPNKNKKNNSDSNSFASSKAVSNGYLGTIIDITR